jgi:hypothetical protein
VGQQFIDCVRKTARNVIDGVIHHARDSRAGARTRRSR